MTQTIRAAVFREAHRPLAIEEIEIDEPRRGEVLVRTVATGVCHSDLHFVDGDLRLENYAPGATQAVLGHEAAGIVEAVGEGVTEFAPGDHVVACLSAFCGRCDQCLSGNPQRCRVGWDLARKDPPRLHQDGVGLYQFVGLGTYAEKLLVGESNLVKIDDDLPLDLAAVVSCGTLTGFGAAVNTAKVAPGSTVAVFGLGGVGLSCVAGAFVAGARTIIGVDRFPSKADMLMSANGTHFVNSAEHDPVEAIRELTGGRGVDYSFECVGRPELARLCVECLDVGGTATVVGVLPFDSIIEVPYVALRGERRVQASTMGSNRFRIDIPTYLDFYRQGRLKLDELVTSRRSLDDIDDAFRAMKAGEVARQVLVFDGG